MRLWHWFLSLFSKTPTLTISSGQEEKLLTYRDNANPNPPSEIVVRQVEETPPTTRFLLAPQPLPSPNRPYECKCVRPSRNSKRDDGPIPVGSFWRCKNGQVWQVQYLYPETRKTEPWMTNCDWIRSNEEEWTAAAKTLTYAEKP